MVRCPLWRTALRALGRLPIMNHQCSDLIFVRSLDRVSLSISMFLVRFTQAEGRMASYRDLKSLITGWVQPLLDPTTKGPSSLVRTCVERIENGTIYQNVILKYPLIWQIMIELHLLAIGVFTSVFTKFLIEVDRPLTTIQGFNQSSFPYDCWMVPSRVLTEREKLHFLLLKDHVPIGILWTLFGVS